MKILYTTDIHGIIEKYEKIYDIAVKEQVDMIINGGDMTPNTSNFFKQGDFMRDFLDGYFRKLNAKSIYHLSMLGNDDLRIFDDEFNEICNKYPFIFDIAQKRVEIRGFEFIGMNLIPDLPFGLKDRARKDMKDFQFPRQIGKAYLSNREGLQKVDNWPIYADSLPTIEDEMNELIKPRDYRKSIYIIHTPPLKLDLDACRDGRNVGSEAVFNFLKKYQPLLSFHGHIHESFDVSNTWKANLENTLCIQPGQFGHYINQVVYVILDLNTLISERYII